MLNPVLVPCLVYSIAFIIIYFTGSEEEKIKISIKLYLSIVWTCLAWVNGLLLVGVCAFLFEVISVLFFNVDTLDFLQIILAG
jgi:uncharacterized oligopeptide transporter (OPT) family protein